MAKVNSLDELRKMRDQLRADLHIRENSNNPDQMVQIRISMATCGIAAGAKETMAEFIKQLNEKHIDAVVTQTGCMGYCYAEPTIEVKLPGKDPIIYGDVKGNRITEIVDKYIQHGELVEGIIPVNHATPDLSN